MTTTPRNSPQPIFARPESSLDLASWRRYERKRRQRETVRRRALVLLAALIGLLVGATIARAGSSRETTLAESKPQVVVVQPGDSFTTLAMRHRGAGETVADVRDRLASLNGGDLGSLQPGQMVRIR